MFRQFEGFHRIQQPNGSYFTVPVRYTNLIPFDAASPLVVYGFDVNQNRHVVIKKVLLPETTDRDVWRRSQRELYCMLFIEEENVVKLYSTFTPAVTIEEMTEFYIVREYMPGTMRNLTSAAFENEGHRVLKSIFFDICRAFHYLHSMNISHRDLKPQNILIAAQDVKLCDFGHANGEDPTPNTPYIVQRFYRAPEILCELQHNNRISVDIWSLGCILAELLTGYILFPGDDHIDQFIRIVRFLGNADAVFYEAMNPVARRFWERQNLDQHPTPPANLFARFPNHYFHEPLQRDPYQCDLARDLLFRMLVINPDDRINIQTVLAHPYLQEIWMDQQIQPSDIPQPEANPILSRFFVLGAIFSADEIKEDLFEKIKNFENTYNIFFESKN